MNLKLSGRKGWIKFCFRNHLYINNVFNNVTYQFELVSYRIYVYMSTNQPITVFLSQIIKFFFRARARTSKLFLRQRFLSRVSRTWLSLSEFRFTGIGKLSFCCWRQLDFFKKTKIFCKIFYTVMIQINLLSMRCFHRCYTLAPNHY